MKVAMGRANLHLVYDENQRFLDKDAKGSFTLEYLVLIPITYNILFEAIYMNCSLNF